MLASPVRRVLRARPIATRKTGLSGVGLGVPLTTGQFSAELQSRLSAQSSSVQATIAAQTGVDTNNARVQQGAASATALIQNGYNPNSAGDNANLVHAIAGGLVLIPGAGPILAAAVETLWLVGNQISCPVTNAFASIGMGTPCGAPPCKTTGGPWTPASVLATSTAAGLPSTPTGSFASFVVAALAMYAAQAGNCKGGMPPGAIVDACVALWNGIHAGPAVGYFIPPIAELDGSVTPVVLGLWGQEGGSTPAGRAGKDPNVYYAFGPVSKIISDGYYESNPPSNVNYPQDWAAFYVPPPPAGMSYTNPRIALVNTGALLPPTTPTKRNLNLHLGPVAPLSPIAQLGANWNALPTAGKVGIIGGGAIVAAAAGGSLYAFFSNQGIGYFWGKVFDGAIEGGKALVGLRG